MRKLQRVVEKLEEKDSFDIKYIHKVRSISHLKSEVTVNIIRSLMFKGIEKDLMNNNYQTLLEKYIYYFNEKLKYKELKFEIIKKGTVFYRGRLGKEVLKGGKDDSDTDFIVPFHQSQIEAPPHLFAKGGRFNREGVSYLYLASDIKTCLAEIHLHVGQECSIAQFECQNDITLVNLVEDSADIEMKIWYEILTQPIYEGIKENYLITQFLADVLSNFSDNGIWFYSSQMKSRKKGEGRCIVCFKPKQFALVPYSERLYRANSISIKAEQIEDSADEYLNNSNDINSYNEGEEQQREIKFAYLEELIEYRINNPATTNEKKILKKPTKRK